MTGKKNKDGLKQRKDAIQKERSFMYLAVQKQNVFTFDQRSVSK